MHKTAPTPVPMRTVINHMVPTLLMAVLMTFCYLGGFHKPSPHAVPVAVVGNSAQAGPVAAQLQQAMGDKFDVRTVDSAAIATDLIQHQKLAGAFVPSATKPTLILATAASEAQASVVTRAFTAVAAHQDRPLTVNDVVPLTPDDPAGQNGFFFLVMLSVGSYATAIAIGAAGATRRLRDRIGLLIGAGVVVPSAVLGIAMVVFGMFPGNGPAVWALAVLYSLTVLAIGVGLHTVLGRFSALAFNGMFVALNFTSAGALMPPTLQPAFFGWLNQFWLGSGFLQLLNHVVYFPQTNITSAVWIMIGWALAGVAALALAATVERRRKEQLRLAKHTKNMRLALDRARSDGLTQTEALELELEEDVAV